jgi:tryptophan synthase alpha chain
MTYVNPVLRMGVSTFAERVAAAGGSGVIIADLPVDEAEVFADTFRRHGLGLVLFVAPTTTDSRLERVLAARPPFVYGIADLGVTGIRTTASTHIAALVDRVRTHSAVPVVAGVGISTPEQAHSAASVADGVIVGTALVREVMEAADTSTAVRSLRESVGDFAAAMRHD